jgi:hypothetical protein
MILKGLLGDGSNLENPDRNALIGSEADEAIRLERALQRRLERMGEPSLLHPIEPRVETRYPEPAPADALAQPDASRRIRSARAFHKELRKRIAQRIETGKLDALAGKGGPPAAVRAPGGTRKPTDFPGRPAQGPEVSEDRPARPQAPMRLGDSVAAKARRMRKKGGG